MLYQLSYSRVADGYCIAKDTLNGECQTLVNPMTNKDNSLRLPIKNARHYEHVQIKWQVLYLNLHAYIPALIGRGFTAKLLISPPSSGEGLRRNC
ncbi:protein of unknown function [Xenorhabdus nematophila AN6/1]|nr:protein of unknown function [Xenorhabdus nematophila AN6/1]